MALSKLTDIRKSLSVEIEDLQVNGITTFTGSVSIGGTLTYQDVTNVDSVGIITAQAGISITGGDLTIPDSIIHLGDTNTKIRFPAADTISFETAGSERVRIKSNGYVGINSTSPAYPLDVLETTDNSGLISIRGSNDGYDTGFLIRNGPNPKWYLINDVNGTGGHSFEIRGDGWSNDRFLTITQSGDVGIGVYDPDAKLEVLEDIYVKGSSGDGSTGIQIRSGSSALSNQHQLRTGGGLGNMLFLEAVGTNSALSIKVAGSERLGISSTGVVNIGAASPAASENGQLNVFTTTSGGKVQFVHSAGLGGVRLAGTAGGSGASLVFSNNYNSGTFSDHWTIQHDGSNDSLKFLSGGTGGTDRLRIDDGGDVFIGTTSDIAPANGTNLCVSDATIARLILEKQSTIKFGLNVSSGFTIYDETNDAARFTIDSSGRLLTGGASTSQGSTNADDLQIGANNQSNQTGITLGSASASSIRFADANDDTAGSVYYGHGDDIMRFYAGSNQRFTVSGTTATASASIITATIFRSGGPGGGLGITMGGLAAGSGSSWVNTGISVNASNGGRTMMILGSRNTGAGYSTQAYMWLLRFAYDGNNLPSVHNVTGNTSFWSIRVSGSNTLEINGNSGNWQFGGVYVN